MSDVTPSSDPRKAARPKKAKKPKKPYPDFPLTPHNCGAWQKKIRGRTYYFGRWGRMVNGQMERIPGDGWEAALEEYRRVADDLHAGRTPRINWDQLSVAELCNKFLTAKLRKLEAGELGAQMFRDYKMTTDLIVSAFGKSRPVVDLAPDDFERLRATMAGRWGPVRLRNMITRVKGVFSYALDNRLIDRPVHYGGEFKMPDKAVLRRHRAQAGKRMLEAVQLRALIAAAPQPLKAMTLLGVNAGLGNTDCATLPLSALDLDAGWLDYPRPKTGIPRRCPLWPEAVAAIREALAVRPRPRHESDATVNLVFLTGRATPWIHTAQAGGHVDNITIRFRLLLKEVGLHRPGLGFYTLRHVFRTVADAARDPVAIDLIMGHTDPSMAAHYRERVEDSRLLAVSNHVRQWLFGDGGAGDPDAEPEATAGEAEEPAVPPRQAEDDRPTLRLYVG
jgi:integrase